MKQGMRTPPRRYAPGDIVLSSGFLAHLTGPNSIAVNQPGIGGFGSWEEPSSESVASLRTSGQISEEIRKAVEAWNDVSALRPEKTESDAEDQLGFELEPPT